MSILSVEAKPEVVHAAAVIHSIEFEEKKGTVTHWSSNGRVAMKGVLLHIGRSIDTICDPVNPEEVELFALLKRSQEKGYVYVLVSCEYEKSIV